MKQKYIHYALLLVIFSVAGPYQACLSDKVIRSLMGLPDGLEWPVKTARTAPTIDDPSPQAAEAGVHRGDELVAVEGRPFTGLRILLDRLHEAKPGDSISLTIRHTETEGRKTAEVNVPIVEAKRQQLSLTLRISPKLLLVIVFGLAMPIFSLLLGLAVVALKPGDLRAWLLLASLLGFSQLTGIEIYTPRWGGWLDNVMAFYHTFFQSSFGLLLLLIGVYFPERLSLDARWPWLKWLLIAPNALFITKDIFLALGVLNNLAFAALIETASTPYKTAEAVIYMGSAFLSGAAITYKLRTASSPDARRRLGLLLVGMCISLAPSGLIIIAHLIGLPLGVPLKRWVPLWLFFFSFMLICLMPLTFAYVIVAHRALDIRVVIRQGVRYAFARGGVRALRLVVIGIIAVTMIAQVRRPEVRWVEVAAAIGVGLILIFMMGRLGDWLIAWTDRRFFREAYNAEQILSELSEKVRSMVETAPLVETVARRIAESLHVSRIALLLHHDGVYRPAHAIGYPGTPEVAFSETSATVQRLRSESEPLRIYLDDADSWVNKTPGMDKDRRLLEMLETQLLLPMAVKEKLPGFISLGPKMSEEPYSATDLRLLESVATQTGLALEHSQLTAAIAAEAAQRAEMNRELEIAREVQERLFPQRLPPVPGLDYCGACRPARGVGGDYYDFLSLPGELLGLAIGDVSGKGIAAALLMASLQASLRGQALRGGGDMAELMGHVNRLVYEASGENRYATLFYSQYDPGTRGLTYVNAGHNAPFVLRQCSHGSGDEWQVVRLEAGGTVVGLLPHFPYRQAGVSLERGDLLVAFTDGISEAMNRAEEEWGEECLIEAARSCHELSASDTLSRLMQAADEFAAGARQHDDMTLLVVRVI